MGPPEILAAIRQIPDQLETLCQGLSDEVMRRRPSPGEWSVLEVCCHLRDAAQIEGERIRRLIEEDEPLIEPYDQEALARRRAYASDDPRRVLMAVRAFWGGLAYQLEGLSPDQWQRSGRHPELGRITVISRGESIVAHGKTHVSQVKETRT